MRRSMRHRQLLGTNTHCFGSRTEFGQQLPKTVLQPATRRAGQFDTFSQKNSFLNGSSALQCERNARKNSLILMHHLKTELEIVCLFSREFWKKLGMTQG